MTLFFHSFHLENGALVCTGKKDINGLEAYQLCERLWPSVLTSLNFFKVRIRKFSSRLSRGLGDIIHANRVYAEHSASGSCYSTQSAMEIVPPNSISRVLTTHAGYPGHIKIFNETWIHLPLIHWWGFTPENSLLLSKNPEDWNPQNDVCLQDAQLAWLRSTLAALEMTPERGKRWTDYSSWPRASGWKYFVWINQGTCIFSLVLCLFPPWRKTAYTKLQRSYNVITSLGLPC